MVEPLSVGETIGSLLGVVVVDGVIVPVVVSVVPVVVPVVEREARAQEVLGQIYEQCPRAVDYVVRFIEWRKVYKNKLPRHLR